MTKTCRACGSKKQSLKSQAKLHCQQAGGGVWKPYAVFMAFCLGYSALSGALVSFGAPLAAGSGIPEIKTYLNGVHVRGAAHSRTHAPLRSRLHCTVCVQADCQKGRLGLPCQMKTFGAEPVVSRV